MAKPQRIGRRASTDFTPLVVRELQSIEEQLGGRGELVGLLTLAPLNPDLRYVLGLLGDPVHHSKSLATICQLGNILPSELLKHLESAALLRGKVLSAQIIGRGMPKVVEDVMRRAAPYEGTCHTCQGTGTEQPEPTAEQPNPPHTPCAICKGFGVLLYPPDLEHQKLALEMSRLLPKGGGMAIIQNNTTAAGAAGTGTLGGGSLERLSALTDQILYHEEPLVTEGEVLTQPPPVSDPETPNGGADGD